MKDQERPKELLLKEIDDLRSRVAELEKWDAEHGRAREALSQSVERLKRATSFIVDIIVMVVETRDPYMAGHQKRVADLARSIAVEMGLSEEIIEGIGMAGLIHDLGKISVPTEILGQPRPLTDVEYGLVKTHPEIGYHILKDIDFYRPVAQAVYQHHERINGTGYPQGIKGDDILVEAKILGVADVVEAICRYRPYRPASGIEKALKEISQYSGVLYEPEVVDACTRLFSEKDFRFKSR
ncbi:MAG TPA: HD domain-containing phosphohydrolase [Syntrophales bacterium]|nr:HD domain-containing phosphohydrolase [Syntrophales bacterium]